MAIINLPELVRSFPTAEEDDSRKSLRTYYNYAGAYAAFLEQTYGEQILDRLAQAQEQLTEFNALEGGSPLDSELEIAALRGWLTFRLIEKVQDFPEIMPLANYWLPVQAYYAVHGLGIAVIRSLGQQHPPTRHSRFLSYMSEEIIHRFFPAPLSWRVSGCCVRPAQLHGISLSAEDIRQQSNLEHPPYRRPEALLGKCLTTTREKKLEEKFSDMRRSGVGRRRPRRNLRSEEKSRIVQAMHPTSVMDFLYRVRIRANYDDPNIYIYGSQDGGQAETHYRNTVKLTRSIISCLDAILKRKIGDTAFETLKARLPNIR